MTWVLCTVSQHDCHENVDVVVDDEAKAYSRCCEAWRVAAAAVGDGGAAADIAQMP